MTNEEAKKMLKAKLDCLIRETSGTDIDCNNRNCDECNLCYAQGNMGEQKEALELAIKALDQEPSEGEEVIKVSKGVVKARQGRFVIYDVEWLKKNFYLTEEKIYGQPKEPCEDCISRKAELDGLASIAKAKAKSDAQKALMGRVMYFTEQLPPVTPQPKIGHWIVNKEKSLARCSNCKFLLKNKDEIKLFGTFIQGYNYCPYCGYRMIEPQESEGKDGNTM